MKRRTTANQGEAFTLIELLVVISIIALLIALLLPALSRAQQQATIIQCQAQIRGLIQGVHLWADDHDGRLLGDPAFPDPTFLHGDNGWDNNSPVIRLNAPRDPEFMVYFGHDRAMFFCPDTVRKLETHWRVNPFNTMIFWGYHYLGPARWIRLQQGADQTGSDRYDYPQRVYDEADSPLWADFNMWDDFELSSWYYTSHPGADNYQNRNSGQPPIEPIGRNLGLLGGSVEWTEFTEPMKRSIEFQVGWWASY